MRHHARVSGSLAISTAASVSVSGSIWFTLMSMELATLCDAYGQPVAEVRERQAR
jgi:hypothetical protein